MEPNDLKSMMTAKLGGGKGKKKKAKLHMHIRPLDDGKFHVEHSMQGGEGTEMPERQEHAPADLKALLAHVGQHYQAQEPDADEGNAAPEPAAQA